MKMGRAFLLFIVVLIEFVVPAEAKRGPNIQLTPALTQELNSVLENTEHLQQTFFRRYEPDVKDSVQKLLMSVERAKTYSTEVSISDRQHLLRLLNAAEQKLLRLLSSRRGESRRKNLQEAFETLAHLPRIYSLDSKFKIFFCNKDRSSWIQSARRPQNPIHPESMANCGSTVE